MILHALYQLYDRLSLDPAYDIAPAGYSSQNITFAVLLSPEGELLQFVDEQIEQPLTTAGGKITWVRKARQLIVPGQAKATGKGINPGFLWDNARYMLGHDSKGDNPARVRDAFAAFRAKHLQWHNEIDDPAYRALCRFLHDWQPQRLSEWPPLPVMENGFGVFRLQGDADYLHQRPAIRRWWEQFHRTTPEARTTGCCLITGQPEQAIARIHEPKIKGVRHAQSTGALLVSFNSPAFLSYGKEQSHNAPVAELAAFRYCTALNALLHGPRRQHHSIPLACGTLLFWCGRAGNSETALTQLFAESGEEASKAPPWLLESLRHGTPLPVEEADNPLHLLLLSANAGRIAVRYWLQTTVGQFVARLHAHYQDLRLERPGHDKNRAFLSIKALLRETAAQGDFNNVSPLLEGAIVQAIAEGTPYPHAMATALLRRVRSAQPIYFQRAALLKAWLSRLPDRKGEMLTVSLDPTRPDPAYRLGRLLAVLEKTQADALPEMAVSLRDRCYGAASLQPGLHFPRLLRLYHRHLPKLLPNLRAQRQQLLAEILQPLAQMPARLSLEEQALFAIGYYHQRLALFSGKAAACAA
ncbi:MAG: type I-C CRISPR-associated protein Cas8c/Csd1 [Magnetococcales bacterium]|nr:type I-C CRISPR-associated protein Cas8c/Csd1 [Magnetococcales bacterium]